MNKFKKILTTGAAATLLLGNTIMPAFAAAFSNGGFESADISGNFATLTAVDTTSLPGWTVATGSVDHIDDYWQPSEGQQSIDLSGNGPGSIAQTFDTVVGATYTVTFDVSGNPDDAPSTKTGTVMATGTAAQVFDYTTGTNTHSNMLWEPNTYTFVATTTSTTLAFTSTTDTAFGPAIDNVRILEEIPTPTPINPFDVPEQCDQTISYNLIEGTSGSEVLNGTSGPDLILAKGGSDVVNGKEGNDCIVGDSGSDLLKGGSGNDVILGGDGSDSIKGEADNDDLYGQNGSDAISGGLGNDDLFGGANSDSLRGDLGTDTADGGAGSDACNAETEDLSCEA